MWQHVISDWLIGGRMHTRLIDALREIDRERLEELMQADDETFAEYKPDIQEDGD